MSPDLRDFGVTTQPNVQKLSSVELGPRLVGYIAADLAHDVDCYVSERDSESHRYRGEYRYYDVPFEGDGYGLSTEVFPRIHGKDISRIYIFETDTETVYQFSFQQFVDGAYINTKREAASRGYEKDAQKVVQVANAVDQWDMATREFYAKQPGLA